MHSLCTLTYLLHVNYLVIIAPPFDPAYQILNQKVAPKSSLDQMGLKY